MRELVPIAASTHLAGVVGHTASANGDRPDR